QIPDVCDWLSRLPEPVLFCDSDRFVNRLYQSALADLQLDAVIAPWHRYAVDLNRKPEDQDMDPQELRNKNAARKLAGGFHWRVSTRGDVLLDRPITASEHTTLRALIYEPFHQDIQKQYESRFKAGFAEVYHLDLHSMPSRGTEAHRDPGELRADVVISDSMGKSARPDFVDVVLLSFVRAGLKTSYNWPYYGGRLTEHYGKPQLHQHCVQVELNRSLYMDEETKQYLPAKAEALQKKLHQALVSICHDQRLLMNA
ncbi:MAG: N-formylglutamate amidohydrolase, partial [Bdellovibrio sp.]